MIALIPMAMTAFAWLIFFLIFSGLGMIALAAFRMPVRSGGDWYDSFWLGWSLSLVVLQLWHLFYPVDDLITIIFALAAASALLRQRNNLLIVFRKLLRNRALFALLLLCLLWMSNRAIEMPDASDTGFRDLQAVMWIASHPIVPGLNNLFSSLAYNHSVYLYDALLDVSLWSGRAQHIATGLLVMAYLLYPLHSAVQIWRGRKDHNFRWSWIFATMTIPYVFYYTVGRGGVSHLLTDTPVDLLGFLTVIYLLDFLQDFDARSNPNYFLVYRIAVLVLIGLTIKHSFVVFGISSALFVIGAWYLRGRNTMGVSSIVYRLIPMAALALLAIVPWMIRGVITSGYIAYPLSIGRVEVEWAEPVELISHRQERLATNTRQRYAEPDQVLGSWSWLGPWFRRISSDVAAFVLPVSITLAASALYLAGLRRRPDPKIRRGPSWLVYLPLIFALLVWFFTFPNIKYIRFVIWSFAGLSVTLAFVALNAWSWRARLRGLMLVLGLSLLWALHLVISQGMYPLLEAPAGGYYDHPLPPIKTVETESGLRLNVPNSHIPQCWQIPLPCTPYPRDGIYELVPGEYWRGFGYRAIDNPGLEDD